MQRLCFGAIPTREQNKTSKKCFVALVNGVLTHRQYFNHIIGVQIGAAHKPDVKIGTK